ncbi:amidohydrolase family protein [Novosphingobium sp. 9U]|uniref:N-acyl-D-amino-acid deacylase family protein n=1 Tax=Novosphingobium sp. 9U TaxID=2653158 RepID=UPI0012F3EF9D|nr:amidohydrolase family protein [Novosphingobium sp. 9U]VWX50588.1 D-aminoacylase domain-containing protein [Novosphingobium sp. 9U]
MQDYDLIIRNGTIIDGTKQPRRKADLAVLKGKIVKIGSLGDATAKREIDATGRIVSPGVIDPHTHYDAPLHWDPYVTSSSWHGTTTIVMGNCGFGYAPCRPADRDRYMWMMVNTEQIPYESQRTALNWSWETFPEWMENLRNIPKGVNVGMFLPLNPLLVYVKSDEVKSRPTTDAERQRMGELLNEAMDAGALGFSLSLLGNGNGHVDYDGTPVPTDVMDTEDAYYLAGVMRERGEGVIQSLVEIRMESRREISENLARISGRPVIHNVITVVDGTANPTPEELKITNRWREQLEWVDRAEAEGLEIYLQSIALRGWAEFKIEDSTLFNAIPVLEEFAHCRTNEARMAIAEDPEWRARAREAYRDEQFVSIGGGFEKYVLANAYGHPVYQKYVGQTIGQIVEAEGRHKVDVFFDILVQTKMQVDFKLTEAQSKDGEKVEQVLRHPRVIPGASDGGAHVKQFVGGHYPSDLIGWMVKEDGRIPLEDMHHMLSARPARLLGLQDRGLLIEGYAADIVVYDLEELGFDTTYVIAHDLPGGDWRRTVPARGVDYVLVNGTVIMDHGQPSGDYPGQVVELQSLSAVPVPELAE